MWGKRCENQSLFWFCERNAAGLPIYSVHCLRMQLMPASSDSNERRGKTWSPVLISLSQFACQCFVIQVCDWRKYMVIKKRRKRDKPKHGGGKPVLRSSSSHRGRWKEDRIWKLHTICRLFSWCDFDWRSFLSCTTSISRSLVILLFLLFVFVPRDSVSSQKEEENMCR